MPGPFIELRDVWKSFGNKTVLKGASLEVERGETMVILGGSGSGKSVLLRHIVGLMAPDKGEVFVQGEKITGLAERDLIPLRKKVAMQFQQSALFDSLDVYENVAFALREHTNQTEDEIRDVVTRMLALVDLPDVQRVMPTDLSGGMKKRVALARSLALQPEAILYDEPTTGLDPITANTINDLIRALQKKLEVTSVVVTHDINSAEIVADRIGFLHEGTFIFAGTLAEARSSKVAELTAFLSGGRTPAALPAAAPAATAPARN